MAKPKMDVLDQYDFSSSMLPQMEVAGWSPKAQANILHQMRFESRGKPIYEDLHYKAPAILSKFGKRPYFKGMKDEEKQEAADALVALGPEAIANAAYGGILGNVDEGDGWKYRGRGFVQLTGRDNYRKIGKIIGYDLEKDPDLIIKNPKIAEMASIAYLKDREKMFKLNYEDLSQVSKAITGESFAVRMQKAEQRGIVVPTEEDLSFLRPAEDEENFLNYKKGLISAQTYLEKRGF